MRRVWDVPIRLFHWLLVSLIGFSWYSAENEMMDWHQRSGLAVCGLIIFRLIWGLLGSNTARFSQFLKGPRTVISYLKSTEPWQGIGHNPVGGWSSLLLILIVATQVSTGLFAVDIDGIESGPLSHFVDFDQGRIAAGVHHLGFDTILILSGLHIAAILFYLFVRKRNLIKPMISGDDALDGEAFSAVPLWRLALSITIAATFTWAIARGFIF